MPTKFSHFVEREREMSWNCSCEVNTGLRWSAPGQTYCRTRPASLERGVWRLNCLVFTLTRWNPKFPGTPFHSVSIGFERQKNTGCKFAVLRRVTDVVALCSWCDAELRARKTFGGFPWFYTGSILTLGLSRVVQMAFFFSCWYLMKKLQTGWKSKWYQNINFVLLWLRALRSFSF